MFTILFFTTLISGQLHAEVTKSDQEHLRDFLVLAHGSQTPGALLEKMKNSLPPEAFSYLKTHIRDLGDQALPKISVEGDLVMLEGKGSQVSYKIISTRDQRYLVNDKPIDFSRAKDMDDRARMILEAFPKSSSFHGSRLHFSLSQANADSSLSRIGGPVGAAAAVTVFATLGVASPLGWGVLLLSVYLWNEGICDDIGKERTTCLYELNALKKKLGKEKNWAVFKSKSRSKCEEHESAAEDREVFGHLRDFVYSVEEKTKMVSYCYQDDRKSEFLKCTKDYSMLAFYSCVFIPPELSLYLEPWAKDMLSDSKNQNQHKTP